MNQWITKQQILGLIKYKTFKTEDEFRDYLVPRLAKLFGIKENQIDKESLTTSFDSTLSNRADIIIRTDDNKFKKALIVIELKLSKSVDNYKGGDYGEPGKQLKKYCQDTRAPYGILLTESFCAIFRNKYFSYDQEPKRNPEDNIPSIKKIKDILAREALLDFFFLDQSMKYIYLLIAILFVFGSFLISINKSFGFLIAILLSLSIGTITGLALALIFKIRKTFD